MKTYDVTVAGYLCIDLFPDFGRDNSVSGVSSFLVPGRLIEIEGLSFMPGGVVANTGLALKKFNKKVFLNGLTGDDFVGRIAREWFETWHLSEGIKTVEGEGTALSIVIAPPGIDRIFLESTGCNKVFDNSFIDYEAASRSRIFHFGYPPLLKQYYSDKGRELRTLFSEINKMRVVTSLDFSLPDPETESGKADWPEIMKNILPFTDIFVPSIEEVLQIMLPQKYNEILSDTGTAGMTDFVEVELIRSLGRQIIESGTKILLIKMAHRGAYLLTGDISSLNEKLDLKLSAKEWNFCELLCNAYHVEQEQFKNATAAGDTAVAAFLSAILNGEGPGTALKYAAIAGRNKLYCNNIYSELSDWQTMTRQIRSEPNELVLLKT